MTELENTLDLSTFRRDATYSAFYAEEPYTQQDLDDAPVRDFTNYNVLRMWKEDDRSFPFIDAHENNYLVRDGSDFETVIKPRIHERLNRSRNMVLFLTCNMTQTRALEEEIDYGINVLGLPVIIVYGDFLMKSDIVGPFYDFKDEIRAQWSLLPIFRDNMRKVPTMHIPMGKGMIADALSDPDFMVQTKARPNTYFYQVEPQFSIDCMI